MLLCDAKSPEALHKLAPEFQQKRSSLIPPGALTVPEAEQWVGGPGDQSAGAYMAGEA